MNPGDPTVQRFLLLAILHFVLAGEAEAGLLVENVTLVSSHLSGATTAYVLIENGRIKEVTADRPDTAPDVRRLNGSGKFLAPGIMDAHVHVSSIPGLGFTAEARARARPGLVSGYLRQQPRSYLYHGVTQVLDPNPGSSWQVFEAAPRRPDFFRCAVITSSDTYPFVDTPLAAARAIYPYLVAGPGARAADDRETAPPPEPADALVARAVADGAVCIKLYFEDGFGDASHWPLLPEATVAAVRRAAHDAGVPVLAHANALDMYEVALAARVDVMAHGVWNWGRAVTAPDGVPEPVARVLDRLHDDDVGYVATQRVMTGLGGLMAADILDDPAYARVTPAPLLEWYGGDDAQWFRQDLVRDFDGLPPERIAGIIAGISERGRRALAYLHARGHPALLGSDCPGSPTYVNQPGLTTLREMQLMAEAGLGPADVLAAATINNARRFGLEADYGTVEPGKVANLLLLSANPLVSVDAWNEIEFVILHGEAIPRASLLPTT